MAGRGVADRARPPAGHDRLAAGARSRRARPARSAATSSSSSCRPTRAPSPRSATCRPQMVGVPAGCRRHRPRRTRRDLRAAQHGGPSRAVPLRRAELPEPDRPADQPRQARARCSTGRERRDVLHRRRRPVPRSVLRGLGDRGRRAADQGRRCGRARRLPEQLLEDARARVPRRVDRCAGGAGRAKFEIAKQAEDLCTGGLDQRVVYEACRRGVLDRRCRCCARTTSTSAT